MIFIMIPLFYLPHDKKYYWFWSTWQQALWERGDIVGVPILDRSTINFGRALVWTPTACVPGKCFIHCAMPLRLKQCQKHGYGYGWLGEADCSQSQLSFFSPGENPKKVASESSGASQLNGRWQRKKVSEHFLSSFVCLISLQLTMKQSWSYLSKHLKPIQ